jgi:putative heme iron utilization protein
VADENPDQTDNAAKTDKADKAGRAARALLATESVGLLSTISVRHAGTPYGSLTPYALSAGGAPLLLLSGLAAHTHNLRADPRAGLYVGDRAAAADPQAGARVSLMGRALPVPAADTPDARARYVARWPRAVDTVALHDFTLWRFEIEEARFIGGFGDIRWLPATAFSG